ncbi:MAG: hypothetical protein ABIG61_08145 [Planctomycetota bacterium]
MTERIENKCRRLRSTVFDRLAQNLCRNAEWVENHIAGCDRCQRRIRRIGRVEMGLALLKTTPQKLDLLMRANTSALRTLKHSLQQAPKADHLRHALPEPTLFERLSKHAGSIGNIAACIAIFALMKIGVFSSMDKVQRQGQNHIQQYYANRVGEDISKDLFTS